MLIKWTRSFVTGPSIQSEAPLTESEGGFVCSTNRPNIPHIIKTAVTDSVERVGIVVCGPQGMTVDVRQAVSNMLSEGHGNVKLFVETFGW